MEGVEFRAATSTVDAPYDPNGEPLDELNIQFLVLKRDLGRKDQFAKVAAETFRPEALLQESDRAPVDVVLGRTAALLADLKRKRPAFELASLESELGRLRTTAETVELTDTAARLALFKEICQVRRQIAFKNPLLNFDQILFIKRQWMLLRLLSARHYGATIKEMAREMAVSEKTIRRDLETFQSAGFPLEETVCERGLKRWRIDAARAQPALMFAFDEAVALYVSRRLMEPLAGIPFWDAAQRAFRKIRILLGAEALRYLEPPKATPPHTIWIGTEFKEPSP